MNKNKLWEKPKPALDLEDILIRQFGFRDWDAIDKWLYIHLRMR